MKHLSDDASLAFAVARNIPFCLTACGHSTLIVDLARSPDELDCPACLHLWNQSQETREVAGDEPAPPDTRPSSTASVPPPEPSRQDLVEVPPRHEDVVSKEVVPQPAPSSVEPDPSGSSFDPVAVCTMLDLFLPGLKPIGLDVLTRDGASFVLSQDEVLVERVVSEQLLGTLRFLLPRVQENSAMVPLAERVLGLLVELLERAYMAGTETVKRDEYELAEILGGEDGGEE